MQHILLLCPLIRTISNFLNYILTGSNTRSPGQRIRENETIFRNLSVFMYKTERFFTPNKQMPGSLLGLLLVNFLVFSKITLSAMI